MSRHMCVAFAVVAVVLPSAWCDRHDVRVEFYVADGYHFSEAERESIQTIADSAAADVRRSLPTLPRNLVLKVQAGKKVIPETGENGYSSPPNIVYWIVDPDRHGGVTSVTNSSVPHH